MLLCIFFLTCFIFALNEARTTESPLLGAPVKITNSTELSVLVEKILNKYNAESNDPYYFIKTKVLSATRQLVGGFFYDLQLLIGKSNCLKNEFSSPEFPKGFVPKNCKVGHDSLILKIHATVFDRPWEHIFDIKFVPEIYEG